MADPPFLLVWRQAVVSATGPESPITRLVLHTLCVFMDGGGRCFPSIATIAEAAALGDKAVRRHLQAAEEGGWLTRTSRGGSSGQGWRRYAYQATIPEGAVRGTAPLLENVRSEGPHVGGKGAVPQSQRCGPSVPKVRSQGPTNSPKNSPRNSNGAFDRAWSLYPKRAGGNPKKAARRAWDARIRAGVSAEELVAAVERYAAYVRAVGSEGSTFVKQAATFFGPDEHWREGWEVPAHSSRPTLPARVVVHD